MVHVHAAEKRDWRERGVEARERGGGVRERRERRRGTKKVSSSAACGE